MSDVEDHSELPDFLTAETLARICVDLSRRKAHLQDCPAENTGTVVRTEALLDYYWRSLRTLATIDQAFRLINNVESEMEDE